MGGSFRSRVGSKALRLNAVLAVVFAFLTPSNALASEPAFASGPVYGSNPLIDLRLGDAGDAVEELQTALQDRGFYRGSITGEFDLVTEAAVVTLHKYLDISRTGTFNSLDWIRLEMLSGAEIPHRWDEPNRVEIDTTRQLMFIIRDYRIVGILPTSTGSGATYFSVRQGRSARSVTPHGDFHLRWRQYGWNCDSITGWCIYNYWAFTGFYGIHGYGNVPAYPASHGCARVNIWDSDWLDDWLFVGMPVHIWQEVPDVAHRSTPRSESV